MTEGTGSLIMEVAATIIFIVAFFMILAPMFNMVETITPDPSIDTGSPIYVDPTFYINASKDAAALFILIVLICGYIVIMTHIGT